MALRQWFLPRSEFLCVIRKHFLFFRKNLVAGEGLANEVFRNTKDDNIGNGSEPIAVYPTCPLQAPICAFLRTLDEFAHDVDQRFWMCDQIIRAVHFHVTKRSVAQSTPVVFAGRERRPVLFG